MSIKLMAAAWELDIPTTEKMVLLCLCDYANDHGVCWPSRDTLAQKCSTTDRTVRKAVSWLEDNGFVTREQRHSDSTIYTLNVSKLGGKEIPPQPKTGGKQLPLGGKDFPFGGELNSPKPSYNHQEPPIPIWMPVEEWKAFLEMRRRKKSPPTERAIKLLVKELDKLRSDGHDPGAVLDQSTMRGWQGVFPLAPKANGKSSRSDDDWQYPC